MGNGLVYASAVFPAPGAMVGIAKTVTLSANYQIVYKPLFQFDLSGVYKPTLEGAPAVNI